MVITSSEAYLCAIGLGAARGAYVGWRREALTSTIVLGTVLFLSTGGDGLLANLFSGTGGGGTVAQAAGLSGGGGTGGSVNATTTTSSCTIALQMLISKFTFLGMTVLGYWVGRTQGPAPTLAHHRITGLIPGAVNGAAVIYYASRTFFPGAESVQIFAPTTADTTSYLPLVFGAGLILMIVLLFIASQARKTYASKK